MRTGKWRNLDLDTGQGEDAADLVELIAALEHEFDLEQGTLVRELTTNLARRRQFEELKLDHDVGLTDHRSGEWQWGP